MDLLGSCKSYSEWTCGHREICVQSIYFLAPNDRTLSEIPTLINRTLTDASSYLEIGDHLTLLAHTITFRWHESLDTLDLFRHQVFSVDQFVLFPVSIANGRQSLRRLDHQRITFCTVRISPPISECRTRERQHCGGGQQIITFLRDLFYSG